MGKVKNLEKKAKPAAEFDKKNPENRKKSINDAVLKKKLKAKDKTEKTVDSEVKIQKSHKKKKLKILQQIKKEVEESKTKPTEAEQAEDADKLIKRELVKKAIIALKDGINKEIEKSDKKDLFDEELRLGLQVISAKIPQCPNHTRKILLTHSLFDQQPDICFFIKDAIPKKGDQDENIRNFQEKLKEAGIENVKTIIPITNLKNDYKSNNLKLKLCNTYDVFLVESEIAEHVYSILGKHFITKRKRPMQIDMKKEKSFKTSIENAIRKVSFKLSSSSNLTCFEVGTMKMENVNIADNIMSSIDQLKEKWPGSWKNISRLYLKPMKPSKVTIPIYYSNINPNDIEVPVIQGAKQNRLDKLADELKKKSKKLKLDIRKKRLVKNAATPKTVSKKDKDNKAEKTKGKKAAAKTEAKEEKVEGKTEESAVGPVKKKKKATVTEEPVAQESQEPAKEKKNKKNKKGSKVEEQATTDAVEPADEPAKKKKKKAVNIESVVEESVEQPALEKPKKIKNKNKTKSNLVDKNSDETAVTVSEKEQISIKKKNKKNKA
ncbi:ribosomal L1 domain-containing protein 1-like [Chironomus tepperi]|uniref:ribosomal L1 domain-containing protein 1-like n=1 Tax=Chironomus tepperi TaxID=113505 RepID=UPI00391F57B0